MKQIFLCFLLVATAYGYIENDQDNSLISKIPILNNLVRSKPLGIQKLTTPCTCGIFLEGQLSRNGHIRDTENPIFSKEMDIPLYPCGVQGNKQCLKKCIDMVFNYMPNLGPLICTSIDRDCVKEKPYLFVKNCENTWRNTGFSAGKEFCCNNGLETKCRAGIIPHQAQQAYPNSITDILASTTSSRKSIPEILLGFFDRATDLASNVLNFNK